MTYLTRSYDETVVQSSSSAIQSGTIKWFDPQKGFGFVIADTGGPDILLHVNVLLNFGQSSIVKNARVDFFAQVTNKGAQVIRVTAVHPLENSDANSVATMDGTADCDADAFADVPLEPARVKWFDNRKGFGFANVFGKPDDVYVHIDVLQRSGLSDLKPGEALAIGVVEGERGQMAVKLRSWESCWKTNVHSRIVSYLPRVTDLVDASPEKEHDDEDHQRFDGRAANWLRMA